MELIMISEWQYTQSVPAKYIGDTTFMCKEKCQYDGHTFLLGSFADAPSKGRVLVEKSTGLVAVHAHEVSNRTMAEYIRVYESKLNRHNVRTIDLVTSFSNKQFSSNLWMTIVESGLLPRSPWEDLPF